MDTYWASDCETPVDITLAKSRLPVVVCAGRSDSPGIVTSVTLLHLSLSLSYLVMEKRCVVAMMGLKFSQKSQILTEKHIYDME